MIISTCLPLGWGSYHWSRHREQQHLKSRCDRILVACPAPLTTLLRPQFYPGVYFHRQVLAES